MLTQQNFVKDKALFLVSYVVKVHVVQDSNCWRVGRIYHVLKIKTPHGTKQIKKTKEIKIFLHHASSVTAWKRNACIMNEWMNEWMDKRERKNKMRESWKMSAFSSWKNDEIRASKCTLNSLICSSSHLIFFTFLFKY